MSRQMITVVCCQATDGMFCSISLFHTNNTVKNTIRAVNEESEEVRSVSSSETGLLLKRKRQYDVNYFDKGADKRNRCKAPENKIRTTNGTVVEDEINFIDDEFSPNSLTNVSSETSLMQLSYTELISNEVVNEETDSEIKSIDDEIFPNSRTNFSSETFLSQQSYTNTTEVDSSLAFAKELQNREAKEIQFGNARKIANFAVDCEEEFISESEFNTYVWTPLLKNAFLGKDDLKLSCGELTSNTYEKLTEILDISGRSAPRLNGKGLLKALGTEILVQEDGVLNTRSKRKGDLKKLGVLFKGDPYEIYLFENTIIMMDLQDIEVPRTVEGFSKLIMAVKVVLSWKARTRKTL
ncbi:16850_t:CDS:2 [Funneliformis caledonium]|uniref:16850_t:CDS:1 n=1 Tax=Funneliformis caledonium TaxID=1117310 RepID=A0A9N9DKR7_9GLOM|nr:16850_t:CDS:2 [Funneliformis caledonium]